MVALSAPTKIKPNEAGTANDQFVQFLSVQCRTDAAQLQQQISELWRVVADLEAWNKHVQSQMHDLGHENAVLKRRLSDSRRSSDRDMCNDRQQLERPLPSWLVSKPPGLPFLGSEVETRVGEGLEVAPSGPRVDGIFICVCLVDGRTSYKVQWRIGRISAQLCGAMGRALVSPEFDVGSLLGLRLMAAPDVHSVRAPNGQRAKELHKKLVTEGPLDGCLMLKVPNAPDTPVEYYASISEHRMGPFATNFSGQCLATHGDFGVDWLQERESDGSLVVGVEIFAPTDPEIVELSDD